MRLRITDRILAALAGLLLIAAGAALAAQLYFQVDLIEIATKVLASESAEIRWGLTAFAAALLILGIYCLFVLFRHRRRKDKFILQKSDNGDLAISIKALENMVQKCVDQHPEIQVQRMYLENRKDGLLIRLRASVAGGISIPLTVEAMQKQIRQYVTACSGVEIRGIRVQIESSGDDAENAPFAIAAPESKPLLKEGEEKQTSDQSPQPEETQQTAVAAAEKTEPAPEAQAVSATQIVPPVDEDDDRPLHQRLFSSQPEPCIVPEPPAEAEVSSEVGPESEKKVIPETENFTADALDSEEEISAAEEPEEAEKYEEAEEETDQATGQEESEEPGVAEGGTKPDQEIEPEEPGEPTEQKKGADPEFLASLSAFDRIVAGEKEQEE